MTSNVGSRAVASRAATVGYNTAGSAGIECANMESEYRKALTQTFAPEFINRINDIVIFNTLSQEDVKRIVGLEISTLSTRASRLGYNISISESAAAELVTLGYQPQYGVRSLKRTILDRVEEPLAQMIVSGEIKQGDTVDVDFEGGAIKLLVKAA